MSMALRSQARTRSWMLLPFLALAPATAFGQVGASSSPPTLEEMAERLRVLEEDNDRLRGEVGELRAKDEGEWLSEERAAQIRQVVTDVLADSDTRASLQGASITGGWNDGFFLASPDGRFSLAIEGLLQARWIWSWVRTPRNNDWQDRSGFELPHTQITMRGHVIDRGFRYLVRGEFASTSGVVPATTTLEREILAPFNLLDAYVAIDLDAAWVLRAGQFKLPFSRATLLAEGSQMGVERAAIDLLGGLGRSPGLELAWQGDSLQWRTALSSGANDNVYGSISAESGVLAGGTNPQNSPYTVRQATLALTSRVDWKIDGAWSEFADNTNPASEGAGLLVGFAAHYQQGKSNTRQPFQEVDNGVNKWVAATADVTWNFGGWSLFGAAYYHHFDTNWGPVRGGHSNWWGLIAQGSVYVAPKVELFGRWEYGNTNSAPTTAADVPLDTEPFSVATLGFNWYLDGQDLRFSFDGGWVFREVPQTSANPRAGYRISTTGDQFVLRTMFQLQF